MISKIAKKEFLAAIEFILTSTYFSFNGKIYKQTYGTPMGSPFSPIVADIVHVGSGGIYYKIIGYKIILLL